MDGAAAYRPNLLPPHDRRGGIFDPRTLQLQSDQITAIVDVCNEIARLVEQMEGKPVNPALLSAVFDVLMQARVRFTAGSRKGSTRAI